MNINKIHDFYIFLFKLIKTKDQAVNLCKESNYKVRVVREDKNNYIITMDLHFNRVNLEIDNGLVTKCGVG